MFASLADMLTAILLALLVPPALVLLVAVLATFGIIPGRLADSILHPVRDIQQPPAWARHVMGVKFNWPRFVLWLWLISLAAPATLLLIRVWAIVCGMLGHKFTKTYGQDQDGVPRHYCSRCYRWRDSRGFRE